MRKDFVVLGIYNSVFLQIIVDMDIEVSYTKVLLLFVSRGRGAWFAKFFGMRTV